MSKEDESAARAFQYLMVVLGLVILAIGAYRLEYGRVPSSVVVRHTLLLLAIPAIGWLVGLIARGK
jgi:hypothetical protein